MDGILYQRDVKRMVENATYMLMFWEVQAIACSQCSRVGNIQLWLQNCLHHTFCPGRCHGTVLNEETVLRHHCHAVVLDGINVRIQHVVDPHIRCNSVAPYPHHMSQLHVGRSTSWASGTLTRHGPRTGACLPFRWPCLQ